MSRSISTARNDFINQLVPGIYQHFKGNRYKVYGIALNEQSNEKLVLYRQLYGDFSYWLRPLDIFLSSANTEFGRKVRFFFTHETNKDMLWDEKMPISAIHSEDKCIYIVSNVKRKKNMFIANKI